MSQTADPSTAGAEATSTIFIGGEWSGAERTYERFDPAAPSRSIGTFSKATEADVERAFDAAAAALRPWAATPARERAEVLRRAADLLEGRLDEATAAEIADVGKAERDSRGEVVRTIDIFRYQAGAVLQAEGELFPATASDTTLLTISEPLGVIGAITPWNFPFAIPGWKLAPALVYGNTVVWKPAEAASGSAVILTEVLAEAGLPAGVLNLVTGSGRELSGAITGNRHVAGLTFTGSVPVGETLRRALADSRAKLQLELGGKNPAIVLADADLVDSAAQAARGAMLQTGQRCTATSRIYVEESVKDEFVERLVAGVEAMIVGDPTDPDTAVGPVASREQLETVSRYLGIAAADNLDVRTGGSASDGEDGFYVEPTVIVDVPEDHALMREEIFGPVVCVNSVSGLDEAIERANDTEFGLSAGIFTRDLGKAMRFMREIEVGLVHVNRETGSTEVHVPFGGVKDSSSMQREQGMAARDFFTVSKTVYLRTPDDH
jgi:acyl-CoA reductase-like NAD-dependent aldehyde dehydrogenase